VLIIIKCVIFIPILHQEVIAFPALLQPVLRVSCWGSNKIFFF